MAVRLPPGYRGCQHSHHMGDPVGRERTTIVTRPIDSRDHSEFYLLYYWNTEGPNLERCVANLVG